MSLSQLSPLINELRTTSLRTEKSAIPPKAIMFSSWPVIHYMKVMITSQLDRLRLLSINIITKRFDTKSHGSDVLNTSTSIY
ncbi:hypothetical protein T11_9064 [Trichinella zimbabwensis]|uniref:Uncharacterized protein n=1 Tax=Trichinella zimbabwensis TaxID=268475 RepID=A0A0V1H7W7_9BILA|nr:hypothetical protein T11_9064 [Trichinella zimbabwensis]